MSSFSAVFRSWFLEPVLNDLANMSAHIRLIHAELKEVRKMVDGIPELDAAIAAEGVVVSQIATAVSGVADLATKIAADVQALLAKIGTGGSVDLTNEVVGLQAQTAALATAAASIQTAADTLTAADTAANPPPPAP